MEMRSLLIEQRDTGDKFRSVERDVLRQYKILFGSNVGVAGRRQAEEALALGHAELLRLGKRMLDLDVSVTIAALRPPGWTEGFFLGSWPDWNFMGCVGISMLETPCRGLAMDKIRDTALATEQSTQTTPVPQRIDEAALPASEITSTSTIEERFANWGSD
jgi:hypothetical protein